MEARHQEQSFRLQGSGAWRSSVCPPFSLGDGLNGQGAKPTERVSSSGLPISLAKTRSQKPRSQGGHFCFQNVLSRKLMKRGRSEFIVSATFLRGLRFAATLISAVID